MLTQSIFSARLASLACLLLWGMAANAEETWQSDALFHIERSKNANIVQYDAQVGSDGRLHPRMPVVAYWIRLAEEGQVKPLSWFQKTFYYGFDVSLGPGRATAEMDVNAASGPPITIQRDGEDYRALALIDGEPAWLDRIYVHSSQKGNSKSVDYVEFFGTSVADGSERHERVDR